MVPSFGHPTSSTDTLVRQGALSGGGYDMAIQISPDGKTRTLTYDSGNAFIWNADANQWENLLSSDRMPGTYSNWRGTFDTPNSTGRTVMAAVPGNVNSAIIYMHLVASGFEGPLFKSTDRGATFTDTGLTLKASLSANTTGRGVCHPYIAVDPVNDNVLYLINSTGKVYRSLDGLTTMTEQTGIGFPGVTAATTMGCIAFDTTGGTTTVSGQTVTKNVYLGWNAGATAVYESTDGGQSFAATSSGPSGVLMFSMAPTGVLFAVSSAVSTTTLWRYASPTNTAGLTASTWTRFTAGNVAGNGTANTWHNVAADPINLGRVAAQTTSGAMIVTNDYGATWYPAATQQAIDAAGLPIPGVAGLGLVGVGHWRVADDVRWLGPYVAPNTGTLEDSFSAGGLVFDPMVSGRVWISQGIGVWYADPPIPSASWPGAGSIVAHSVNKNQQGMILNSIIKPPGRDNPLIATGQDRMAFVIEDVNTEPQGDIGIVGSSSTIGNCWGADFAKDGSDFRMIMRQAVGSIWTSNDKGATWTNTIPDFGMQGEVACQTSTNFVVSAVARNMKYTTNGTTLQNCLFEGAHPNKAPICNGWVGALFWNRHILAADWEDSGTYYAFNQGGKGVFNASVSAAGSGYSAGQQVAICNQQNGGGGIFPSSYFTITSVDGSGGITGISIADAGDNYNSAVSDGDILTVPLNVVASSVALSSGGSGYAAGNTLTISGQPGQQRNLTITVNTVDGSGTILTFTPTQNYNAGSGVGAPLNAEVTQTIFQGYGYFSATQLPTNPVSVTGGAGTGASFNLSFSQGTGASLTVTYGYNGGFWKSSDGGATWTRMYDTAIINSAGGSAKNLGAGAWSVHLKSVKGYTDHLLYANGTRFSPANIPAYFSKDGGATWDHLRGVTEAWCICAGKEAPGASYPTIFFGGKCSTDARPTVPGIFRTTDFDPNNPTATPTWVRVCDAPAGNVQEPRSFIGDWDDYGSFYCAVGGVGYVYGRKIT